MVLPLIAGAAVVASGGLSSGAIAGIVTAAAGIGSGIGYGVSMLFGKNPQQNSENKPLHKQSLDRQNLFLKERDDFREQKRYSALEKANQTKDVLQKTKRKTNSPVISVHRASMETGTSVEKINNATKNARDASQFFSQALPKLQEETKTVQDKNEQLLKEIERLNTLLDGKITALDKATRKAGKLTYSLNAQTDEIKELKDNIKQLKEKISSLMENDHKKDAKIKVLSDSLDRAENNLKFFAGFMEKNPAELKKASPRRYGI